MEKTFTEMDNDEWELLYNKSSRSIVQELVLPSQAMEEEDEELSLGSNIKPQDLTAAQPKNFPAAEFEPYDEVVEEEVEQAQFPSYEKQCEDNEEEEDGRVTAFEAMADIASEGKSESISFTEEDEEEEEEEVGEMVEYNGPVSEEKNGCKAFRLRNLLRSAGLAAATFSIFILQKSMLKNNNKKIQFKICKNEKAKQLFQHQQEVSEPLADRAHSSFSGRYDEWY